MGNVSNSGPAAPDLECGIFKARWLLRVALPHASAAPLLAHPIMTRHPLEAHTMSGSLEVIKLLQSREDELISQATPGGRQNGL